MKLHGLARVKNEGDVIEEFVRHNLRFLDALIVVDNASFDGTLAVLEALRAEGLPLTIVHDATLPKRQYETMTRVARQSAADDEWDFLFLLDADEFLKVPGRGQLEESLRDLSPGQIGLLPWHSYVPTSHDDLEEACILSRIRYRRTVEARPIRKAVLPRWLASGGNFEIGQGNHVISDAYGPAPASLLDQAGIAHFPVRSLVQIQGKALVGWGAYIAMGHETSEYGWHQRRLFQKLESSALWSMNDLYEIALHYTDRGSSADLRDIVCDPMPTVGRRYLESAIASATQIAAMYVRQLARAVAEGEATAAQRQQNATDR
jgi:glycosyltransferase involved in cell wall biosynthesis